MLSVMIWPRTLATSLFLLLAVASPGMAHETLSEDLPVRVQARLGWGTVRAVQYSPDGTHLAAGGSAGIWLFDTHSLDVVSLLPNHLELVTSLAFSPDSRILASGNDDRTVHLWDVATGTLQQTLQGHTSPVYHLAFSPDGRTLASAGNSVRLWDVAAGTLQQTLQDQENMAFSPAGGFWPALMGPAVSICGMWPRVPSGAPYRVQIASPG